MNEKTMYLIGVLATLLAVTQAWPNLFDTGYERYNRLSRRSECVGSGAKCFSSNECCSGFVCAAFDDYFVSSEDEKPEVPGLCVKEKDLLECQTSLECPSDHRCLTLSRSGDRYCIRGPKSMAQTQGGPSGVGYSAYGAGKGGGLGTDCETDSDCKAYTEDGSNKLCCQKVKRGRQGVRTICDRLRTNSKCVRK